MTRSKKILLAAGGVVVALIPALPLLFAGQIEERVRAEVQEVSGVQVSWSGARLGLLGDFPHPSLRLDDLVVRGAEPFTADTLVAVGELAVSLHGPSLLGALRGGGPLVVRTVTLDRPRVALRVTEDGTPNWPRSEGDSGGEAADGRGMDISLQRLEITDGDIEYDDASSRSTISLRGLQHTLRGDFSRAALEAETRTYADALSVRMAGTPYLADVGLEYEGVVRVDTESGTVELDDQ